MSENTVIFGVTRIVILVPSHGVYENFLIFFSQFQPGDSPWIINSKPLITFFPQELVSWRLQTLNGHLKKQGITSETERHSEKQSQIFRYTTKTFSFKIIAVLAESIMPLNSFILNHFMTKYFEIHV